MIQKATLMQYGIVTLPQQLNTIKLKKVTPIQCGIITFPWQLNTAELKRLHWSNVASGITPSPATQHSQI